MCSWQVFLPPAAAVISSLTQHKTFNFSMFPTNKELRQDSERRTPCSSAPTPGAVSTPLPSIQLISEHHGQARK